MGTKPSTKTLTLLFWVWALLLGAIQAWNYRYVVSSDDSISYLDIADAYLRGDWHAALNSHWSPLYSWILALALFLVKPTSYWELPTLKIINFTIYLGALAAFSFFLRELIKHIDRQLDARDSHRSLRMPEWVWIVSGYLLFLWSSLNWTTIFSDTPDMTTAALVYVAAGLLLRVQSPTAGWSSFVLFGITLGFAYLSKSPLLPLSLVFLAAALVSGGNLRRALPRVAVAAVALALIAGPFIAALSMSKGRLTFGDAGKYVFVTFVNPGFPTVPLIHWQGDPVEFGTPKNATRQIADTPAAFEFATPLSSATYPPWYEPSHWYTGLNVQFDLKQQTKVLIKNAFFCWSTFLGAMVFGYIALVSAGDKLSPSIAALKANWAVIAPAVIALGMFCLVTDLPRSDIVTQPAMRYISPFVVLLFAGVFSTIRFIETGDSRRWVAAVTLAAAFVLNAGLMVDPIVDRAFSRITTEHVQWRMARDLTRAWVTAGDKIARLGADEYPYWARLAGIRIISEIPNEEKFWAESAAARAKTLEAVCRTGAKLVVNATGRDKPTTAIAEGWMQLSKGLYIYRFATAAPVALPGSCLVRVQVPNKIPKHPNDDRK